VTVRRDPWLSEPRPVGRRQSTVL